ncbi:unnamed protein product [Lymnaea stagnalis]|uniref:Uncharacterized protein n=1 Tax=Lymnaea stagnalis TaxID=6523 RepID=A0AAV2HIC4_LYMST
MEMCQRFSLLLSLLLIDARAACSATTFGNGEAKGTVGSHHITEASGLAASHVHNGVLYTHNDKGDSSHFFAVQVGNGNLLATFVVRNAQNYDWEDIAVGPCADDCARITCSATTTPSRYCIYIADTGDHGGDGAKNIIYMIREPANIKDATLDVVDTLSFSWTEPDAETLMVSPDGRLFIVSKVHGGKAKITELPASAWGQGRVNLDMSKTATLQITTTSNDPQGGDISPDGTEILLVAEEGAYYFSVPDGNYINAFRSSQPARILSYQPVPSTEAICWSPTGSGFYVLAEGSNQKIYYYPKISGPTVVG